MKVGFVGLGVMGQPMARNLVAAGFEVTAYTRTAEVLEAFVRDGGKAAGSPAEAARASEVVITMLPDSAAVEAVMRADDGVFAGVAAGDLVIDMSTIDPGVARELAEEAGRKGADMLDAPVSGGDVGAREGTLSIMVGGSEEAFSRVQPVFEALGKTIVHVGGPGAGQVVKACNQVLVGITYAAVSEALVLGRKHGVAPEAILDVLSGGLGANRIMEVRRDNFLSHRFVPGFRVDLHHKDLRIALDAAGEVNATLPLTAVVQQMFQSLRARGDGGADHSALLKVVEALSGLDPDEPAAGG